MTTKPYRCPVCNGTVEVQRPPWIAGEQATWPGTTNAHNTHPCKACGGTGMVWREDDHTKTTPTESEGEAREPMDLLDAHNVLEFFMYAGAGQAAEAAEVKDSLDAYARDKVFNRECKAFRVALAELLADADKQGYERAVSEIVTLYSSYEDAKATYGNQ